MYIVWQKIKKKKEKKRNSEWQKSYFSAHRYRITAAMSCICKVLYFVPSSLKAAVFQYSDSAVGLTRGDPAIVVLAEAEVLSS